MKNITTDAFTRLGSIKYLDMSDNMFDKINRDTLMSLPKLERLSFASNEIQEVESRRMTKYTSLPVFHKKLLILFGYEYIITIKVFLFIRKKK